MKAFPGIFSIIVKRKHFDINFLNKYKNFRSLNNNINFTTYNFYYIILSC